MMRGPFTSFIFGDPAGIDESQNNPTITPITPIAAGILQRRQESELLTQRDIPEHPDRLPSL